MNGNAPPGMKQVRPLPPSIRALGGMFVGSLFLLLIGGALYIPFGFESSSILYKFGFKKNLLRIGQILGMVAACLLLLQLVWSGRLKILDRIFTINKLYVFHRLAAIVLVVCAMLHPALIFIAEDMLWLPWQLRYWPEFLGILLLLSLIGVITLSYLRRKLGISFEGWWRGHRVTTAVATLMLFIHVRYVSDTFARDLPKNGLYVALGIYLSFYMALKAKTVLLRRRHFIVSSVARVGKDAYCIKIKVRAFTKIDRLIYFPGQFGFIGFRSPHLAAEEHPFTIASSPLRPDDLSFVIRDRGDWTHRIKHLRPGDKAFVDGPYGCFSHLRWPAGRELIMIAGGIGITPMLSMLRYMQDMKESQRITLIWSNRTKEHIVLAPEFEALPTDIQGLKVVHVLTEQPETQFGPGRLSPELLERLLVNCSRQAGVLVCGPPKMMKMVSKTLVQIGYSRRSIVTEHFSL